MVWNVFLKNVPTALMKNSVVHIHSKKNASKCTTFVRCKLKQNGRICGNIIPVQTVPITTQVVSSNLAHGEVYSIQHFVIKFFFRGLRQVNGFLRVFLCPPPIKLTGTI